MLVRSPFPIPFGWFQVAWSTDLAPGEIQPIEYFDRKMVLWRDGDGAAHVSDAFCPHLGAHFGYGGHVNGNDIVCPFHGWRFDCDGRNTLIPYSERTNKKACVKPYPVREVNGLIMAWYHPEEAEPTWEIPVVPEFNDPENFTAIETREYLIGAPWQDLAENGVDAAHFRYVHHTEEVPELESYETDGPLSKMRSIQKFPTPRGVVDGRIDADSFGPGFSVIRFSGIVDTYLMGCNTPLTRNSCFMRFTFTVRKLGDDALSSTVGEAFVAEIDKQVQEDRPIWQNKAYAARPALADSDGPFTKFRKWASQFYAEGIDESQSVYYPVETKAYDPIQTASRKFGSDPMAD
ncbi:MAG TPA: Rieske 2Fe-2S domain-containing protein [Microthrixaceae bacterium]|nr:Rieske 2Fe-2S domain-containing protein [Microthrixaceae bacterium]